MAKNLPIVAIVGRANVGKSTLFNNILGHREAIVANEAGTTRDSIWAKADYQGNHFWLIDTAGMKDAQDDFEFTIQEQIAQAADSADVIWVMIEGTTVITEEERRVAKMALKSKKPVFLVVNKMDKAPKKTYEDFERLGIKPIILVSATQNIGVNDLLSRLVANIPHATQDDAPDRLRIAILGRPNVGKSHLFNTLAKKQQAIVADRAGTTRDINRAIVRYQGREVEILDTAGIRRNGKIEVGIERFSVIRSLSAIEQADVCIMLMDVNELNVQLDQKIAGMIKEAGKGLILAISKWDSIKDEKTAFTRDQLASQIRHNFAFVPWAPLIITSSITGQNVAKIFELALQIDKRRQNKYTTSELNRWLRKVVSMHPPAGLKNRAPKLNYIVHEDDNPIPSFKVFGAHTKFLHWSYKRYMERDFREVHDLVGSPIQFWFIEKHETHKHGT
ncbi:ribosome biogenesis GTPase Der, partial [Candidatus Saccharibacteria bacterium]|nr:ribosome biogenesis GTPase Der [Candidatus Saccharibacteria bacterium]